MKGVYCLVAFITNPTDAVIGALGSLHFDAGYWVYVGSALGNGSTNLENRIKRHLSMEKKLHWHIDFLLDAAGPSLTVVWAESAEEMECDIAGRLREHADFTPGPHGFGSSDCRASCTSHLFHFKKKNVTEVLYTIFQEFELTPQSLDALPD